MGMRRSSSSSSSGPTPRELLVHAASACHLRARQNPRRGTSITLCAVFRSGGTSELRHEISIRATAKIIHSGAAPDSGLQAQASWTPPPTSRSLVTYIPPPRSRGPTRKGQDCSDEGGCAGIWHGANWQALTERPREDPVTTEKTASDFSYEGIVGGPERPLVSSSPAAGCSW